MSSSSVFGTTPTVTASTGTTMDATWKRIFTENTRRRTMLITNDGANNVGIYFAAIGNANVTPAPVGIGSAGVHTMVPGGDFVPPPLHLGEVWAIGTASDVVNHNES